MADQPFKLRALIALTDALKEITPSRGYQFDVSGAVWRGRAWFGDDDTLPMLSVLEGTSPADEVAEPPVDTATGEYDWSLILQGFVDDDPENPTDPAYGLLADVRRRLAQEKTRRHPTDPSERDILGLGPGRGGKNCITKMFIGSGVVRPADDVSAKAYFWLNLVLRIVDNASEPYA